MNIENIVFKKLYGNKIDLSTHKIDLSLLDNIEQGISKANSKALEAASLVGKAMRMYQEASQISASVESDIRKGLATAKEIGSKELEKQFLGFDRGVSERIKRYNKAENSLKTII